jgi:uncharacterized protein (DUF1800 family)
VKKWGLSLIFLLSGCATAPPWVDRAIERAPLPEVAWSDDSRATQLLVLNRVSFGANASSLREIESLGTGAYLARQLRPAPEARLPAAAQAYIDAMTLSQRSASELAFELETRRRAFQGLGPEEAKNERQAYQRELTRLAREAAARTLLRALYSSEQLREEMTWFWMNHFSVFQLKANVRVLVGDYEERAIRPHALGRFGDLLGAVAHHPAMLVYLDNARNAAGRINENYARELMELHTLGVKGGYTQGDVQELARVLTGFSVAEGEYRFYPRRHDWGPKTLLGRTLRSGGERELGEALELLAAHPSTSRFLSRKLAMHFVSDDPPEALVERMARAFRAADGDIALTLRSMFESPEFRASLGGKFKDPLHYMVSAVRLAANDLVIPREGLERMINGLAVMGQPLYGRPTPDGYPLVRSGWTSPGQLAARFEVARGVGYRSGSRIPEELALPLSDSTRQALSKAAHAQEWNMLLLSSPEFMSR